MRNTLYAVALAAVAFTSANDAPAQQPVLQRGYDPGLSGANLSETTLNTTNVNPSTFGIVFKLPVDDRVYAQPLYVPQVAVTGQGTHNVVYVATMSDTLYAFDADAGGAPLWSVNFASSVGATPVQFANFAFDGNTNIVGNLGILSTPVIDLSTHIMYLVVCTFEGGTMVYRLHAVNIADGTEPVANVVISGLYPGISGVTFDAAHQTQRASLTLAGNQVVFGFGAVEAETHIAAGYTGWVMAYNKQTLAQTGSFATNTTGSSLGGGVWQSGRPPVVDGSGYVYVFTGNGYTNGYDGAHNFAETALKLDPSNGLALVDWFTPDNWSSLDTQDLDLASSGPLLVPNTSPSLLAGGGKAGELYLLNTSSTVGAAPNNTIGMGKFSSTDGGVIQEFHATNNFRGGPVYWQRSAASPLLYNWGAGDWVKAWAFNGTTFNTTVNSQASGGVTQIYPGGILALSANGEAQGSGVLWATVAASGNVYNDATDPGILYAFDATNLATPLYSSVTNSARDNFGNFAKFAPPLVANGKVYVATFSDQVAVYGLLSTSPQVATPTFTPAPGTYTSTQQVTLLDSTSGAVIYYTTNGTTPTTSSAQYVTGMPIAVSTTETIEAIAVASGYNNSSAASGTYTISAVPQAATPTFTPAPGVYTSAQQVSLLDTTTGAAIYYTTNGTTPTTSSTKYAGTAISVSTSETIEAIAVASGYTNSAVASGAYTISTGSATTVNLTSEDNVVGIGTAGTAVSNGGLDGGGYAYASNLLGSSITWSGSTFTLGGAGLADAVSNTTIALPAGNYSSVALLATGVYGNQANQNFVVTYTDGTTTTITQSLSDWFTPQNYPGESIVATMAYRVTGTGATANGPFYLYGYKLAINSAKTVSSLTLPANRYVVVLAIDLVGGSSLPVAATPTFSPPPGSYTGAQLVALLDSTSGTSIYYTTNGTTPTTASNSYTAGTPILVSASETIGAIAVASGYANSAVASGTYTIAATPQAATPTFTPAPGTYTSTQQVTLLDSTSGAVIYYTTNGTTPTTSSAQYVTGMPIAVSTTETMEAIAVASGYNNSSAASGTYTISAVPQAATPTFTPAPGVYTSAQQVSLLDTTTGAAIYYTTNGTTPTTSSTKYAGTAISVSTSETIEAIAVASGYTNSAVASGAYTISTGSATTVNLTSEDNIVGIGTVGTALSGRGLDGGGYTFASNLLGTSINWSGSTFTLGSPGVVDAVSNATIALPAGNYSTVALLATSVNGNQANQKFVVTYTDGTTTTVTQSMSDWFTPQSYAGESIVSTMAYRVTPTGASDNRTFYLYGYALAINSAKTVASIALPANGNVVVFAIDVVGGSSLPIATAPTFSPAPGSYVGTQQVTLPDGTAGAVIYYTTNGTTPTTSSAQFVAGTPISVGATETIEAIAVASGYANSAVASGTYTISALPQTATPTFSPPPGAYTTTQQVTLSDTTSGAVIYYTTNGTTPTTSSTAYAGGTLTVSATETIEAIAVASGYSSSAVATGTYTIGATPTSVNLSSEANLVGIGSLGTAVPSGGLDGGGYAYASNLLGASITWSNATFAFGSAGVADAASNVTLPLPAGNYAHVMLLATGLNGNQANQKFVVTYTDGTTTTVSQSLSDWFTPQSYTGESIVSTMAYRLTSTGGTSANGPFNLYGYSLPINSAKTVSSITLPATGYVAVLAIDLSEQ